LQANAIDDMLTRDHVDNSSFISRSPSVAGDVVYISV